MTTTRRSNRDRRPPESTYPLDADDAVKLARAADLQLADPAVLLSAQWLFGWCHIEEGAAGGNRRRDALEELLERSLGGEPTAHQVPKDTIFFMSSDKVFAGHLDTLITAGLIALDSISDGSTSAERIHFLVGRFMNLGARPQ